MNECKKIFVLSIKFNNSNIVNYMVIVRGLENVMRLVNVYSYYSLNIKQISKISEMSGFIGVDI